MNLTTIPTTPVITIERQEDLVAAAKKMREAHVGFLVVADKSADRILPVGVVTDRDIVLTTVAREVDPHQVTVADVMSEIPFVAYREDDVSDLLGKMQGHGISRLPIVDRTGSLVGVVSTHDLLEVLANMIGALSRIPLVARTVESTQRN